MGPDLGEGAEVAEYHDLPLYNSIALDPGGDFSGDEATWKPIGQSENVPLTNAALVPGPARMAGPAPGAPLARGRAGRVP
jgi:hypothetical protein